MDIDKTIQVGAPATIHLYNDTVAAVVTRFTDKSVWVQRVETSQERRSPHHDQGPYPVMIADGILDKPCGTEERFKRNDTTGRHGAGSIRVTIGRSISLTDYRY